MIAQVQLKSFEIFSIKRNQTLLGYPSIFGLSDSVIYTFTKQSTFLRPKQQRHTLHFFQGLNTNPQNLSIFLMSEAVYHQQITQSSKEKLTKGVFHVYDIYNRWDCVIEINIPGNLRIYKLVQGKKEIVSGQEIDMMYVSSVLRTLYEKNLVWGRYYEPFKDPKDCLGEFNSFLKIFLKVALKHQMFISDQFQSTAQIKGSHSLTLLFRFIKQKRILAHCLNFLKTQMDKLPQLKKSPKINIFLAELYSQQGKYSKSIQCTIALAKQFSNDPYILYYKAKYLLSLLMIDEALKVLNHIVQYNQFEVWTLLAKVHIQKKNYFDTLICLNNAAKISKYRSPKPIESFWKVFEEIGRPKPVTVDDAIHHYVRLNLRSESPLSIPVKFVEEKLKPILEHPAWKFNLREKQIYEILQRIFYKIESQKFQELLKEIFEEEKAQSNQVSFRKGLTESMFVDLATEGKFEQQKQRQPLQTNIRKKSFPSATQQQDLPHFLRDDSSHNQSTVLHNDNRNLSIIPQIQSVIENSNYEQKQPQQVTNRNKDRPFNKRQMNEPFFKVLKAIFADDEFQKAVHEANYGKVLPVYNRLRNASFGNNFYYLQMFKIFAQTGNYNSIVVLLAEYLDFIEGKGMKKVRKLPNWLENWLFYIIDEKGLVFLNTTLNKLNYIDEAVIECQENAKKWKIGGVAY